MNYPLLLPLLFLTATGCGGNHVQLEPEVLQSLKERAETYVRSFHTGDDVAIASMTNPRYLIRAGGAAKLRDAIKKGSSKLRSLGVQVESITFTGPIQTLQSDTNERLVFAIIPIAVVTTQKGAGRTVRDDFMVAIKESELGTWTLIEGNKARQGAMHDLYPDDFGQDHEWPELQRRAL